MYLPRWIKVFLLSLKDSKYVNSSMDLRTLYVNSGESTWITQLLKRAADAGNENKARDLSSKISRITAENQRRWENRGNGLNGARGTKHCTSEWWWTTLHLENKKQKFLPCSDNEFLADLKNFFGDLGIDDHYSEPAPLVIDCETRPPPMLKEHDVQLALSKTKKTASGPDGISYWV